MSTAADLINLALKDIGLIDEDETPSASILADALSTLNQMLALWQTSSVYVPAKTDITFVPNGAASYTIGPTGVIVATPPQKINYAFYSLNGIDYPPITILNTFEEYQSISLKNIVTFPDCLYYNATFPNGVIYLFPQPTGGTMHLGVDLQLPNFTAAANTINLPAEYDMAIRFNLAKILSATMAGKALRQDLMILAKSSLDMIKANNLEISSLNGGRHMTRIERIMAGGD